MGRLLAILTVLLCLTLPMIVQADPENPNGPTVEIIDRVRNEYLTGLVRRWLARSGYQVLAEGAGQYKCRITGLEFSHRSGNSHPRIAGSSLRFSSASWMVRAFFNLADPNNVIVFDSASFPKGTAQSSFYVSANYRNYSFQIDGNGTTKELALENFFAQLPPAPPPQLMINSPSQRSSNDRMITDFGSTSIAHQITPSSVQSKAIEISLEDDGRSLVISGTPGTKICLRFFLRHSPKNTQKPIRVYRKIPPCGRLRFPCSFNQTRIMEIYLNDETSPRATFTV